MQLQIQSQVRVSRTLKSKLQALTSSISQKLSGRRVPGVTALKKAELSLLITDDAGIRKINKLWRKKDRSTDVLSFPGYTAEELKELARHQKEVAQYPWSLGDIVISLETAKRQSEQLGSTLEEEVVRLFVHGLVHLFGYDHEISDREARRMRRIERILLTR